MSKINCIILLFLGLLLFACEEDKLDIEKFGSVKGIILDGETYNPLSGVQIATNPASTSTITDNDGAFEFDKVVEGELAVTARKKDYLSSTVSVAVYDNETTNLTFFLLIDESDIGWVTIYDPVPGNGATDQNVSLTMQWQVDQEDNSKDLEYTVYYFEANSTTQKTAGENLSSEEVILSGLEYNTTYYWYVVAKYEGSRVANSPTWTFRTESED
ncbi:carboxypeptidase regulatory-like domain-containing protein [Draconibacterium sp. IB214405]|uniref:carboxypeptidase regulatory-like domain-containing protein n=1 Tax=Draconibacterium sp. IB214405 TaxID=3097352 RepID=UPI002A1786AC|nr:carboxypeptidase regulatory-like domain-containing protein [Draconibacterium sp. IB214405]MDX8339501.1 carboxypeptidase regulatory-like domain-containing protein [Draconibacterium sp. IB214405]